MSIIPVPIRRRRWPILVIGFFLLALVVAGWIDQIWQNPEDRSQLVWPGGKADEVQVDSNPLNAFVCRKLKDEGVWVAVSGIRHTVRRRLVFQRESMWVRAMLEAGDTALRSVDLQYVLLNSDGNVINVGSIQPDFTLQPKGLHEFRVEGFALERTTKIEIRRVAP